MSIDGVAELMASPMWEKLAAAKSAVWDLEQCLNDHGYRDETAFAARGKLTAVENQLRRRFKQVYESS